MAEQEQTNNAKAAPKAPETKKKTEPVVITKTFRVPGDLFAYIPSKSADLYKLVPLAKRGSVLHVGAVNPKNLDIRDALNFITVSQGLTYEIQKISEEEFHQIFSQYSQDTTEITDTLEQLEEQYDVVLDIDKELDDDDGDELVQEEAPIIKLVSKILSQAVARQASDVHIEAGEGVSSVRFRIDGVLREEFQFSRKIHDSLIARIKIISSLRLDERRRPQDGRFTSIIGTNKVDFRVATFPTTNGEKVSLRVLDKERGLRSLNDLGLSEDDHEKLLRAVKRPYGLILATGPTGAGKTTTLYALLNTLKRQSENIVSLEDPVEYRLDGVNQSNIQPEIGYTFANGLRSVLRGDPDQILVGEIRDRDTALLAIQAALTGHLVYSTLHTNTAIGSISRLINFGIDPFLLAPTLSLVIGQRMVRKLDGEGKEVPVSQSMQKYLNEKFASLPQKHRSRLPEFRAFRDALPTPENPSGMYGRVGAFEVLEVDDEVRSIILDKPEEIEVYKSVRKNGFISMDEDAIIKGLRGEIAFSEVVKISNESVLNELDEAQEAAKNRAV